MLLATAEGNRVPVIARLAQAEEDTVRDVIHRFDEVGLASRWMGGRRRPDCHHPRDPARPALHPLLPARVGHRPRSGARAIQLPQAGLVLGG
ncbi:helix-turn-helix domain-containing protein [Nocardia barduliensis]|uniref:helix-turn-helix domain-containing protein n=1 Tax=Nocardia barduliensis TaxID=2736643 RepID=UPI0034D96E85